MSVVQPDDEWYFKEGDACFLCGKGADGVPAVMWKGSGAGSTVVTLLLHGGCAGTFTLRLARDAWEVEHRAGPDTYTLTRP